MVRLVRGVRGKVAMRTELVVRFDYGSSMPWVTRQRRRAASVHRRSGPAVARHAGCAARRGHAHRRRVRRFATGEEVAFAADAGHRLFPHRTRRRSIPHAALGAGREFWEEWVAPFKHGCRMVRAGAAFAADPEGARALGDRRHRRGRRRRRCRRKSAARATGTIAIAGCATPRSRSTR